MDPNLNLRGKNMELQVPENYEWPVCYEAEGIIIELLDDFLQNHEFTGRIALRMAHESSLRFVDWINHITFLFCFFIIMVWRVLDSRMRLLASSCWRWYCGARALFLSLIRLLPVPASRGSALLLYGLRTAG